MANKGFCYQLLSLFQHMILFFLQEQHGNDDTDLQLMKTHMETLLDTMRDIAQVNTDSVHLIALK